MSIFGKVTNFIKKTLCLRKIRKAENYEELAKAKEEANQLSISENEIQEAIKSGGESALEEIASSIKYEEYKAALARAELFECDNDAIKNAISIAKNKILSKMGTASNMEEYGAWKTFSIQLGATDEEVQAAENVCKKDILNRIRECNTDSVLTGLQTFAGKLSIDVNEMSEALNVCKSKMLSKLSEADSIKEFEEFLSMANHCGASYEEIVVAKKKAQSQILIRIQVSDSLESAKRLVPVAVALGIDYSLVESTLSKFKEQQLSMIHRQVNVFFAGSKSLQAERDLFTNVVSILQTKWQEKNIDVFGFSYENFEHELTGRPPQEMYNDFIRNYTNVIVFVLDGTVGGITLKEFEVALDAFTTNGNPRILVYSKVIDTFNADIFIIREKINEASQYWLDYIDNNQLRPMIQNDLTEYIQTVYEGMIQQKKDILG